MAWLFVKLSIRLTVIKEIVFGRLVDFMNTFKSSLFLTERIPSITPTLQDLTTSKIARVDKPRRKKRQAIALNLLHVGLTEATVL